MVQQRTSTQNKQNVIMIVGVSISILVIIAVIIGFTTSQMTGSKHFKLGSYSVDIAKARLASAKNALDGSGALSKDVCLRLGKLAKEYNSDSDYISCDNPDSLYLETPDTADAEVLTLSDENYTARFTTDKGASVLLDYEFSNEPSSGFNKYEGRR